MIKVEKWEFTKADLAAIAPDQRALLILTGHTLNTIAVWIKLIRLSTNYEAAEDVEGRLSSAQSHILLRSLYGAITEAWEWLKRPESQRLIGLEYLNNLHVDARTAYALLKSYFGGSNTLNLVRNRYAYHYPTTDDLRQAFESVPENEDWSWYISEENTNSFYLSCEIVVGYGAIGVVGEPDQNDGLNRLLKETMSVANALNDFLAGLLAAMVRSNFSKFPARTLALELSAAPDGRSSALHFFFENLFGDDDTPTAS